MEDYGFGLYIHWPFCVSKCPYCDFNSHIAGKIDHQRWAAMYCRELETLASRAGCQGRRVNTIFFGGGTPSLMHPDVMHQLITEVQSLFVVDDDVEITMEANPTSVEAARLEAFGEAGVNRLSMGIQALDDAALTALGRNHGKAEALAALATARSVFSRVSADFIYARPGQTATAWQAELAQVLELDLDHLSLYQLTLEPGTAFYSRHQRGLLNLPDDDTARELYDLTAEHTAAAGLQGYEISNYARPGQESRHNLVYWRAGDWLGIGPGAHGRYWDGDQRIETRSRRDPMAWLDDVAAAGTALDQYAADSPVETVSEILMMGLRLAEGVDLTRLSKLPGQRHDLIKSADIDLLVSSGLVTFRDNILTLTHEGKPVINAVLSKLLASG